MAWVSPISVDNEKKTAMWTSVRIVVLLKGIVSKKTWGKNMVGVLKKQRKCQLEWSEELRSWGIIGGKAKGEGQEPDYGWLWESAAFLLFLALNEASFIKYQSSWYIFLKSTCKDRILSKTQTKLLFLILPQELWYCGMDQKNLLLLCSYIKVHIEIFPQWESIWFIIRAA